MKNLQKKQINTDSWVAIFCILLSIAIAIIIPFQTSPKPIPGSKGADMLTGRFFPIIGLSLFFVSAVTLLISSFFTKRREDTAINEEKKADSFEPSIGEPLKILFIAIAGCVYVAVLKNGSYILTTGIAMAAITYVIGNKKIWSILAVSIITPLIIYLVFSKVLYVPLPSGFLV